MNPSVLSRSHFTRGFVVAGLALFAILVWKIGPALISDMLWGVGWKLPLVVMPHIIVTLFEASGWWFAFPDRNHPIPYRKVLEFTVAAKAIQLITPSVAQVGELLRIHLLRSAGLSTAVSTASVVAAKTNIMIAELLFMALGLALAPSLFAREKSLVLSIGIGMILMAVTVLGVVVWQRVGFFATAIWLSRRMKVLTAFFDRHEEVLVSTDNMLKQYLSEGRRFFLSCSWNFMGWLAGAIEAWVILSLLGLSHDPVEALIVQVWLAMVIRLTAFVPGNLGTQEAGVVMIFSLLGFTPESAIAFALLRRVRQLVWIAAGLGLLTHVSRTLQARASR
ncbi:MAG: flippase-like domain-containing protein [Nitrospirota bacterium]